MRESIIAMKTQTFVTGDCLRCLDKEYSLQIVQGNSPRISDFQQQLIVTVSDKHADNQNLIRELLSRWYQQQAEIILTAKTAYYAKRIGVTPASITIKTFKARWGSCSIQGDIQYNWKIIRANTLVVDYIVIHELCHILQHNHSPKFWQTVAFFMPNYKEAQLWLKLYGQLLNS